MPEHFHGLPTLSLQNKHLRVDFLAEAGPRIVRLIPAGSDQNFLAEVPDIVRKTEFGDYKIMGGHRLWHSPEAMPRSSLPDNEGLSVEISDGKANLIQPVESPTQIQKRIEINLFSEKPGLRLTHHILNCGIWPVELAAWPITQLRLGGTVIFPVSSRLSDKDGLQPNRSLVLWPYTRWQDPRLVLEDDLYLIHGQPLMPPIKIGMMNRDGWVAYLLDQFLFVKQFDPMDSLPHPDRNCNVECYCNNRFIELETLSPCYQLDPGQSVTHIEEWTIFPAPGIKADHTAIRELLDHVGLSRS